MAVCGLFAAATMAPELPRSVWLQILGQLTFKEASQAARTCRLWNKELQQRSLVDLRDCKRLFAARRCLRRHRGGENDSQLILPANHSVQQIFGEVRWGYGKVQLCGVGLELESLPTSLPWHMMALQGLRHVELHHMAFTNYAQAPNGDLEAWYTFNVVSLDFAELESLLLQFDRILAPCESYHHLQGGWIQGLENCKASSVTVVSTCAKPVRLRIPNPVVTLYVLIDDDLYIERPKGDRYKPEPFDGNEVPEADAVEIHDLLILAASTPQGRIPCTKTRQLFCDNSVAIESSRVCITGNATPDKHYTAVLEQWAPGYRNLAHAVEVPSFDWYLSGERWNKRLPPYEPWY